MCAAPPHYIRSDRGSVFVYCPLLRRYPPQPVIACEAYAPVAAPADPAS